MKFSTIYVSIALLSASVQAAPKAEPDILVDVTAAAAQGVNDATSAVAGAVTTASSAIDGADQTASKIGEALTSTSSGAANAKVVGNSAPMLMSGAFAMGAMLLYCKLLFFNHPFGIFLRLSLFIVWFSNLGFLQFTGRLYGNSVLNSYICFQIINYFDVFQNSIFSCKLAAAS
ncbi:unnamed protein product [Ambrosiozyma monospora]|uniref:Unnamed protein product n=1 Tax=Ambrosiozyma monospora TaxID=43982 RepID=A0A9W7DPD4_AMBMO|nr:unnamed protein product [Ambrosiozyma monospora]